MVSITDKSNITLVGHPFAPIGRGEDIRSAFRAFKEVGWNVKIRDIYGYYSCWDEFTNSLTDCLSGDVNIFFINGDEVEAVSQHLESFLPDKAYNIVYPAWELSTYPKIWLSELVKFDEVWTISQFVYDSISSQVSIPVINVQQASHVEFSSFIGRQYFDIPESSYTFLFSFDFLSMLHRKNPFAVIDSFKLLLRDMPYEDVRLILKLNHADKKPEDFRELMDYIGSIHEHTVIINETLSDNEIKNLIRCSDCFISLHRSEGFGRSLAEAMYLEKPVIATSYSGNMDFMNSSNSLLVDFNFIPVEKEYYPQHTNQYWADANIAHAALRMSQVVKDKDLSKRIGKQASLDIRKKFSYSAIGNVYLERLAQIR